MTNSAVVKRMAAHGRKVREDRLGHNGSGHCTVAPENELLVSRLEAQLQGVDWFDPLGESTIEPDGPHRLQNIPFDAQRGKVL